MHQCHPISKKKKKKNKQIENRANPKTHTQTTK